jgi:O-antigen/teichoic acid export membrane protein
LILGVLVSGFSILFLQIFSTSRVPIPTTLLFLAAIYAFLGTLDFNLHQGLIAFGMFKIAAILDLLTVTIQISIYFLFSLSNQISIASSLFTSLIISYVTSVVATVIALLVHTNASIVPKWKDIRLLFKSSIPFHVVGIANGFADRIDRIAIAWFLPLATLGKFAVGTSILSYLRFIPEAFSRLIVGGQSKFQVNASRFVGKSWLNRLFIGTFLSISLAIVSQALIWLVLGKQWLIPFVVVLGFSVQELIRGYFQLRMSELVSAGKENIVARLSVHLIVISAVLSILGVRLAGLIGVPIGIAVAYLILLLFSYKAPYKVTK